MTLTSRQQPPAGRVWTAQAGLKPAVCGPVWVCAGRNAPGRGGEAENAADPWELTLCKLRHSDFGDRMSLTRISTFHLGSWMVLNVKMKKDKDSFLSYPVSTSPPANGW